MGVNLRSQEKKQLLEMLPTALDMYDTQGYDEGVENMEIAIEEAESGDVELSEDEWKGVILALSAGPVKETHGNTRTRWLSKKLFYRGICDSTVEMQWPGV